MYEPVPPFRRDFDAARDPYTARVALGITTTGGGGVSSINGETGAITLAAGAGISVSASAGTITIAGTLFTTSAQGDVPASGGGTTNFLRADGTWAAPTVSGFQPLDTELTALASTTSAADQVPYFTGSGTASTTTVTSAARSVLDDTTTGAMLTTLGGQPLDADLTSIAGYGGTGTWLYRSAADTWSAVTVGTGLSFTGGTLTATGASSAITSVVIQKFTASGTYTPTSGMKYCIIECVGGGGGGGGSAGATNMYLAAGGGGSGAYSRKCCTAADIGASKAVTIGAAGNGGAAGFNNGTAGGDTSVGTLCVAKGGNGGAAINSANQPSGGLGGSGAAGTGDLTASGMPGGFGMYNGFNNSIDSAGGYGGSSIFGGGARGVFGSSEAASNYGSGGGGGSVNVASNIAGGNGSAGIVIITEFI